MAFDAQGRHFVCDFHEYNFEGHYDVQELNKTGVLDMQVRRILASPDAQARAARESHGTVKLLQDDNGDGRMDRMTVWANDLPPCYGVVPAREGVIEPVSGGTAGFGLALDDWDERFLVRNQEHALQSPRCLIVTWRAIPTPPPRPQ